MTSFSALSYWFLGTAAGWIAQASRTLIAAGVSASVATWRTFLANVVVVERRIDPNLSIADQVVSRQFLTIFFAAVLCAGKLMTKTVVNFTAEKLNETTLFNLPLACT